MGKTKNKEHGSEVQFLKQKVRTLEKQVRQLLKELKYYTKKDHLYNDISDEIQEVLHKKDIIIEEEKIQSIPCDRCPTGLYVDLKELLPNKWYSTCNSCGYSKRLK